MANLEEIVRVVKEIENIENHPGYIFDMGGYYDKLECGTSMCFAGWAVYLNDQPKPIHEMGPLEIHAAARKILGLSTDEAQEIFYATEIRSVSGLKRQVQRTLKEKIW